MNLALCAALRSIIARSRAALACAAALLLIKAGPGHAATTVRFPPAQAGTFEFLSGLLCYIQTGLVNPISLHSECTKSDSAVIDDSELSDDISHRLTTLSREQKLDPQQMLDWWDTAQPISKEQRHQAPPIFDKLSSFVAATSFRSWTRTIVPLSRVKRKTRLIYRSPVNFRPTISVAETLDSTTGNPNAAVRETELAIERNDGSKNADFYSYDQQGKLSVVSEFPSGIQPVPSSCLGCHFNRDKREFRRILAR